VEPGRDARTGALLLGAAPVERAAVDELARRLRAHGARPVLDRALAPLTSFRFGGPADLFLEPDDEATLATALREARGLGVPVLHLGGGTNILVADRGVRGMVVRLGRGFRWVHWCESGDGNTAELDVGAGSSLIALARETVERGFAGLEFAAGIPGTVGGGVSMNAGAFGGELADALTWLRAVREDGEIVTIRREELAFSYRKLALDDPLVITSSGFHLLRSSVRKLKAVVERVQTKRKQVQPAGHPNAGSVFKNPPNEYAGRLIERTGLKGVVVGGAQVSPQHANFIVNIGGGHAADVRELMAAVQDGVWMKCGVWLEPELRLVGEW
jgi:UDP-N-acetylmuramate dehydrogenase